MRGVRFFLALYASKLTARLIDLIARGRGTNLPGVVALKIDPQFLAHIRGIDPERTIFITGTNGKSTTTNLLYRSLTEAGFRVISNLDGANMTTGVAVPLLRKSSLAGRVRCDYLVMETDERYVARIRKQIPAKYLCVTNIQKDQVQRNGEPAFIRKKIQQAIGPDMTVFVNQDEPNAYALANAGAQRVVRYGVEPHSESFSKEADFFSVSMPCPVCHSGIHFHTYNIDNTGPFHCPACGFGNEQTPDYQARDVSFTREQFTLNGHVYPFHYNMPQFLYSYTLAACAALELGVAPEIIARAFDRFVHATDRICRRQLGRQEIKFFKMKQENSETLQTITDTIAKDAAPKVLVFGCDEYIDFYPPYVNTCFLFDCSFRRLRESGIARLVCTSTAMGHTSATRFLYDGFDPARLDVLPDSLAPRLRAELDGLECKNIYQVEEIPFWKR